MSNHRITGIKTNFNNYFKRNETFFGQNKSRAACAGLVPLWEKSIGDLIGCLRGESGKRVFGRVRQGCRLVVGDILNAEVLEYFEQCLAVVAECNCAVMRITLFN